MSEIRLNGETSLSEVARQHHRQGGGSESAASKHYHRLAHSKPFVSRTYIGGSSTSSLALKIQRKNQVAASNGLNGSLTSLHETSLNSGLSLARQNQNEHRWNQAAIIIASLATISLI